MINETRYSFVLSESAAELARIAVEMVDWAFRARAPQNEVIPRITHTLDALHQGVSFTGGVSFRFTLDDLNVMSSALGTMHDTMHEVSPAARAQIRDVQRSIDATLHTMLERKHAEHAHAN